MSQFPTREETLESDLRSVSAQLEASYLVGSKMIGYLLKQLKEKLTEEEMAGVQKKLEEIARDDLKTMSILSLMDKPIPAMDLFYRLRKEEHSYPSFW